MINRYETRQSPLDDSCCILGGNVITKSSVFVLKAFEGFRGCTRRWLTKDLTIETGMQRAKTSHSCLLLCRVLGQTSLIRVKSIVDFIKCASVVVLENNGGRKYAIPPMGG